MFHAIALLFSHNVDHTPVRATLGDGQILMGEVQTRTLRLQSGVGLLEIPLADIGEVVPADAGGLGASDGRVNVWLRNGSELRGTWADPKIAMSIAVGGADVPIDLPMNDLNRFQLQGETRWPGGPVYRLKTAYGDDFLVDPSRTHLVLENDLGTFAPLLSECVAVAPVDDPEGPWRVQLQTGTVLLGNLRDDTLTVALPMGPEEVRVALDGFVSLHVETWRPTPYPIAPPPPGYGERPAEPVSVAPYGGYDEGVAAETVEAAPTRELTRGHGSSPRQSAPAAAPSRPLADDSALWFDNSALQATKDAQGQ